MPRPAEPVVTGVLPDPRPPARIARELAELRAGGVRVLPAGEARGSPEALFPRYAPRHKIELFDADYYLTDFRYRTGLNFLVAFVRLGAGPLYPRIFYKDSSLLWRVASHVAGREADAWIGKGDVVWEEADGGYLRSAEETTNLPLEIQHALDLVSRRKRARRDERATWLVLRRSPEDRIEAYADFTGPRRRARQRRPVHGGCPVARFRSPGDPRSLVFAPGYEPDFSRHLETTAAASRLYGGPVEKHRFASSNGLVQYQFVSTPHHAWVNPPQTFSDELSTFGQRPSEVLVHEDLCMPGYEYHFLDESSDPPELHSQIPPGYAGPASEVDPERADASRWIEALPVVREFRRRFLRSRRRKA